jgi:hypothetical protein
MSELLEKLKPSRLKREIIPFINISVITISSLIYFSYQDSTGSINYSPEIPIINIELSNEISNSSQQCFIKFEPISFEFMQTNWANRHLAADIRRRNYDGDFLLNYTKMRTSLIFAMMMIGFSCLLEII